MGAEATEQLERKIEAVKAKIHKTDKAIEFQHQILDRVSSLSRYYDRAHYVLENLSMHTTTLQQVLLRLEADLTADDLIISERLAHDLQISEVQSHRVIFGRLDWPGNPDRPGPAPSRGLRERSTNVPTPRKWYQPSTSADARRQVPEPEVPQQRRVLALRSPATPSVLDQAIIFTPVVKFKKCVHRRLHRLVSPSDMKAMKLLLQKSCENVCGKSTDATYTLAPPLGRKPKPVKMASLEDSSPLIEEVIEVPPATLTAPTKNEDNANHEGDDNEPRKFSDQVNDEVIEYGSADWPIQLDGLNVDQILNLSTEPEDNGHHHLSDCDSSYTPETPQYENSSPIGVRFARSPNYPYSLILLVSLLRRMCLGGPRRATTVRTTRGWATAGVPTSWTTPQSGSPWAARPSTASSLTPASTRTTSLSPTPPMGRWNPRFVSSLPGLDYDYVPLLEDFSTLNNSSDFSEFEDSAN